MLNLKTVKDGDKIKFIKHNRITKINNTFTKNKYYKIYIHNLFGFCVKDNTNGGKILSYFQECFELKKIDITTLLLGGKE